MVISRYCRRAIEKQMTLLLQTDCSVDRFYHQAQLRANSSGSITGEIRSEKETLQMKLVFSIKTVTFNMAQTKIVKGCPDHA